jgi:hypothetical protein
MNGHGGEWMVLVGARSLLDAKVNITLKANDAVIVDALQQSYLSDYPWGVQIPDFLKKSEILAFIYLKTRSKL